MAHLKNIFLFGWIQTSQTGLTRTYGECSLNVLLQITSISAVASKVVLRVISTQVYVKNIISYPIMC